MLNNYEILKMRKIVIFGVLLMAVVYSTLNSCATSAEVETHISEVVVYPQVSLIYRAGSVGGGYSYYTDVNSTPYSNSVRISGRNMSIYETTVEAVKEAATRTPRQTLIESLLNSQLKKKTELGYGEGKITGTVEAFRDGWLLLSNFRDLSTNESSPFMVLSYNAITRFILSESPASLFTNTVSALTSSSYNPQMRPGKYRISWESTPTKEGTVRVSYLAGGLSWNPFYRLDLSDEGAHLEYMAQVTNSLNENLENVDTRLVAGKIRIEGLGGHYGGYMTASQRAISYEDEASYAPAIPSATVSAVGEYEVYELDRNISIKPGQTKNLPLFNDDVESKKTYVWDARADTNYYSYSSWETDVGKNVQVIYMIKNTGKTWSHGTVFVYKDDILIGSDRIEWTPPGREAKVTVGMAPDVEVKKSHTKKRVSGVYRYDHNVTLWLKNYKTEKVKVKIMDTFSEYAQSLEASTPYAEKPGNLMEWNIDINPGQEKTLTYTFHTT